MQEAIIRTKDQLPYGLRYVTMCMRSDLKEKFGEQSEEDMAKVAAGSCSSVVVAVSMM